MTLTQFRTFVTVARLGSVHAAAVALGVSDSAVSQTLRVLREHFGDPLLARVDGAMELTAGGARLFDVASTMVALGAEAEAAVRRAAGAPETLRVVTTADLAEAVVVPLLEAFRSRRGSAFETDVRVARAADLAPLVRDRLVDAAFCPVTDGDRHGLRDEPLLRTREVVVAAPALRVPGRPSTWTWHVDPSATDGGSTTHAVLRRLGVPTTRVRVHPHRAAAWEAAVTGAGVSIGTAHLVLGQIRRGDLREVPTAATPLCGAWSLTVPRRPSGAASHLLRYLGSADALTVMRSPGTGVRSSRYRPPVHVGIWS
ncbi:LysR family transcriptional regulator [Actinomycetospora chiangmaiensis]|uniref:LysR family transcriptional regulator n=1 Tax=Actinomycetospora chiangmaiensis TaxID=402650 RepID=UPI000476812D|nr:LysR family transcriptional regulator [Actinomycetospora chiangmaiensis]